MIYSPAHLPTILSDGLTICECVITISISIIYSFSLLLKSVSKCRKKALNIFLS